MREQVFRQLGDAVPGAGGLGERRPAALLLLELRYFDVARDLFQSGIDVGVRQVELDLPRLVEDGDGRTVLLRLLDVIPVNEVAKDFRGIGPAEADRGACE